MNRREELLHKEIEKFTGTVGLYMKDLITGETIAINQKEQVHAASTIKLPILYEVLKRHGEKKLDILEEIPVNQEDKVEGCGILKDLKRLNKLSREDLLRLMIVISDNTATNILIEDLGIDSINDGMKSLGLHNTYLARKLMQGDYRKFSYTTPEDMGKIMEILYTGLGLQEEMRDLGMDMLQRQQDEKGFYQGLKVYGVEKSDFPHKTGSIDGVFHDVGILQGNKKKVVMVGLTHKTSHVEKGMDFLKGLVQHLFEEEFR